MSKSFDRTSKVAHRRIQRQMAQNTERINRLLKKYAKIGQGFTDFFGLFSGLFSGRSDYFSSRIPEKKRIHMIGLTMKKNDQKRSKRKLLVSKF